MQKGYETGLVPEDAYERFIRKKNLLTDEIERLKNIRAKPQPAVNEALISAGTSAITEDTALEKILKRPQIGYSFIKQVSPPPEYMAKCLTPEIEALVEINVKYEGYIQKQMEVAEKLKKLELRKIPHDFDFKSIPGLSREIIEKLCEVMPETIGQAGRIPGVTPAAVAILMVAVNKTVGCRL
jgi:tRNA uridine 5-carboxymethylaminomethyl modification enzyme